MSFWEKLYVAAALSWWIVPVALLLYVGYKEITTL